MCRCCIGLGLPLWPIYHTMDFSNLQRTYIRVAEKQEQKYCFESSHCLNVITFEFLFV